MSSAPLPPNPSLVAIILIIKTRQGVKHIYHYPPNPGRDRLQQKLDHDSSSDEGYSSSEASYSSVEDDVNDRAIHEGDIDLKNDGNLDESGSASPEKNLDWKAPTESPKELLGLPVGFEAFLCPSSTYHKKRFEMTIDQLTFIGWPCFARGNGEWKRKSKHLKKRRRRMSTISEQKPSSVAATKTSAELDDELGETTGHESVEESHGSEGMDRLSSGNGHLPAAQDEDHVQEHQSTQTLNMFHVIFVMNPPPLEYQVRVDDMYKHVVKKFSRALKWEQARSNFVLRECEKLKSLKAKHNPSSQTVLQSSSLAKAIATLYASISTSRIAHIDLTTHLSFSLQIPIVTSISHLPCPTSPQLPGVWLTTATSIPSHDEINTTRAKLASHFALLLLSDLSSILSEIASTSPLAAPLAHYLRCTTPTKSFHQISQSSSIPLDDIYFLASHLIYWRRARAIPPLHQRDVYVVSPNADMRKLRSASAQFAKLFPALPSLPKILSLLASANRPYRSLIPNKDHKPAYMDILAWLMRGGWVTQLRTFAWVRVPEAVQAAVAEAMEEEARQSGGRGDSDSDSDNESNSGSDDSRNGSSRADARTGAGTGTGKTSPATAAGTGSGYLTPLISSMHSAQSTTSSHSSARTAIPLGSGSGHGTSQQPHPQSQPQSQHQPQSHPSPTPLRSFNPRLILHPSKASGLESRYLDRIAEEIERIEGREAREAWGRCVALFDGEHALDAIAVREGWKRKKVEGLRAAWVRMGFLCECRHW